VWAVVVMRKHYSCRRVREESCAERKKEKPTLKNKSFSYNTRNTAVVVRACRRRHRILTNNDNITDHNFIKNRRCICSLGAGVEQNMRSMMTCRD